ncbi:hypothetical protein WA026_005538 [Henosepilachna vigintioctopunctata]|uniref:Uncharacterized protein n=1 Tax=Henosepilachna vigintioctopunctata TaxID=420089 RepID=A0AAW1TT70_9CUCU
MRTFSNIIQCAYAILLNYTVHTDLIHVVSKEDRLDVPVVLWDYIQNLTHPSHPIKPSFYFITDLTEWDIELLVENLLNDPSFNARAKFIVVAQNLTNKSLEVFGSRFIVNVVFVDIKTGIISTYFPYRRENITDFGEEFVTIGRCLNNGTVIL